MNTVVVGNYMRIPFFIQAVRISDENMNGVAEWCGGHVIPDPNGAFVLVPHRGSAPESQYKGIAGSYVTRSVQRGIVNWKVMTSSQLNQQFNSVSLEALGLSHLVEEPQECEGELEPTVPLRPRPKPSDVNFRTAPRST